MKLLTLKRRLHCWQLSYRWFWKLKLKERDESKQHCSFTLRFYSWWVAGWVEVLRVCRYLSISAYVHVSIGNVYLNLQPLKSQEYWCRFQMHNWEFHEIPSPYFVLQKSSEKYERLNHTQSNLTADGILAMLHSSKYRKRHHAPRTK